jgi:hypothetical protein
MTVRSAVASLEVVPITSVDVFGGWVKPTVAQGFASPDFTHPTTPDPGFETTS